MDPEDLSASPDDAGRARPVGLQAAIEMLRRELDASRSVNTHLRFVRRLAESAETATPELREALITHIDEEEREHQDHLGRLVPALESLTERFSNEPTSSRPAVAAPGGATTSPAPRLTVGSLIAARPWYTRP